MKEIYSFPPIADQYSKVLILGTMPGKDSLRMQQYYANIRNNFWSIVFALFDQPLSRDYEIRKKLLLKNKVAIWDTLKVCLRQGSADSAITDYEPNDISGFVKKHPNIQAIFCNGKDAEKYFKAFYDGSEINCFYLPSTSAAHAIGFQRKLNEWSVILNYL